MSGRLSVVIPVLNAAKTLPACLAVLSRWPDVEIVVSDGGSSDKSTEVALQNNGRVVAGSPGRGVQLARGASVAGGDWLLFLHADTVLDRNGLEAVERFMADPSSATRAAYFRFALGDADPRARRIERCVAWRCRVLALPYGDQGLLIARAFYESLGGYRPLPLMEDVDLIRRIGRSRLRMLDATATTSAARYRRDGWTLRPLRNLLCLSLHFAGVPPKALLRFYAGRR
ncbi:MAG: TIGR04283 family arsenosugar biosynthesis glycosyltransferase [Alphaproteobacteria bacterium]|nr:TIGR04283 family arsenosugar biosynthesis glycosyltransferase [Alphaproteobacteria bacterium]